MYNHKKAQQSKNRVHISWDILYAGDMALGYTEKNTQKPFYFLAFSAIITQKTSILDFLSINLQHSQCMICEKYNAIVTVEQCGHCVMTLSFHRWLMHSPIHVVSLYTDMQHIMHDNVLNSSHGRCSDDNNRENVVVIFTSILICLLKTS